MERLDDLVLFVKVVEHGGFAAAARHLDMQRSKLSRRVGELEQRLGVRLLQRNTRRVSLTPAGERIYRHARGVVEEARAAFDVASELKGEPSGLLRITCPAPFAIKALMPIVSAFSRQYPRLHLLIDASDRVKDLVGEGFDLAFRAQTAPLADSSLVARAVSGVPMTFVASPALVAAHGPLQHPRQLAEIGLLGLGSHEGRQSIPFTHPRLGDYLLDCLPRLVSGNMMVLEAAAMTGLGVACLPRYVCRDGLSSGRLVDVFAEAQDWQVPESRLYAVTPTRHGNTLALRLFLEFGLPQIAETLRAGR